jgi:phosphohistidine swiveling domain-containing protein
MYEGLISFTKKIFGYSVLKRINICENGVANIFVSKKDIEKYTEYIKKTYALGELRDIYLDSIRICKDVQSWIKTLELINYKSLTNQELLEVYNATRQQISKLGPSLILPRLVELALTSIGSWQDNKNIVGLLKDFSELNEFRRTVVSEQMFKKWLPLFKEIALRSNLFTKETLFLLPDEIKILLKSKDKNKKNNIKNTAKKRVRKCLLVTIDGKTQSYEESYDELKNNLMKQKDISGGKRIFGRKACNGEVYGKAVVVLKNSDYKKVKEGDILITPMTQPEIGRVLNKIAGIVTDEGGILAHASILAREQNIPCITATKIATAVIKDGDQLKLDASNGYFEILSSETPSMKQISYTSAAWDIKRKSIKKQILKLNFYEALNPKKLIVWLPGMSDEPYANNENPLLQYFVSKTVKKNYSVVVIAFPGTAGYGFIEERTIKTMKKNVKDALRALSQTYPTYLNMDKILVGRSAGGTLASSILNTGFQKCVIIAGRLKTQELAKKYSSSNKELITFGTLKPFMQTNVNYVNNDDSKLYYQNKVYIEELNSEETSIRKAFRKASKLETFPGILAIQALDDKTVPFQLDQWKLLAGKFSLPINLFEIKYTCGHSFSSQPAIVDVTDKILEFIK